ncbi:MAG: ATP-binding protein [Pseudomonadota bacterium]
MTQRSLQTFFDTVQTVDLNTCDTEAVHRSGAVQNGLVIACIDPGTLSLVAWSENAASAGFAVPESLTSVASNRASLEGLADTSPTLKELFPEVEEEISELYADPTISYQNIALSDDLERNGKRYDPIVCITDDCIFLELVPHVEITPRDLRIKLRASNKASQSILAAPDFDVAAQLASEAVFELTGYDRVKIYQFLPDGSGWVRTESARPGMPSYLGLHFPETDIPKQARHLMQILPYRCVFEANDDISPIVSADGPVMDRMDLTWCLGRSVSTMHTQYLRNMGVSCSFSVGLRAGDTLWGMIACHGKERIDVPYDVWGMVRDIGDALMAKFDAVQRDERARKIRDMRDLEAEVAAHLRQRESIEEVLLHYSPKLQEFLDAEGFAFQFDGEIYSVGRAPPPDFTRRLIHWVSRQSNDTDHFRSNALHQLWPDAREHMDTACGVLIQPVIIHRVCQLVWFRGPITQTVRWAGAPNGKRETTDATGLAALSPRNSFDQWVTEHREEALEWTDAEISAAREIFKDVLDIIASQAQNLKRMNAELQLSQEETREELAQFAYAAAHDIQNPINTITSALEMIRSVQGEVDDPMVQKSMDFAIRSSDRLRNLADQMAKFVALGRKEIEPEMVSLSDVLDDTRRMLAQLIDDSGAHMEFEELPEVAGNRDLLTILFMNLLSNAIKYRHADRPPHIVIDAARRNRFIHVSVTDNGQGIPQDREQEVFKPFTRLHRNDTVSGSGLGLATCQRIAELHKTRVVIDPNYRNGTRLEMNFTTELWGRTI